MKPTFQNYLVQIFLPATAVLGGGVGWADSPLTSTDFSEAYGTNHRVAMVDDLADGQLTPELLSSLTSVRVTLPVKLSIVNAIGWEADGAAGNGKRFLEHIAERRKIDPVLEAETAARFSSEELTLYAYFEALEHYLDDGRLTELLPILDAAVEKHAESYGAHLVRTLIECQLLLSDESRWPEIWKRYREFRTNPELQYRLRAKAEKIVTEYLKLYQE